MTPEQQGLPLKARDSLEAARLLHSHGQHGFAAARAYYTMFYLAETFLLGEGLAFSSHAAVHAAFGRHFAKTGRVPSEFHRYLSRGMVTRHTADYAIQPVSEEEAAEQIARAEKFLAAAEQLLVVAEPEP